jgi:hypothetical protein
MGKRHAGLGLKLQIRGTIAGTAPFTGGTGDDTIDSFSVGIASRRGNDPADRRIVTSLKG